MKLLILVKQKLLSKDAIPEDQLNEKVKKTVNRENLVYEVNSYVNNFQQFETIRSLVKNIREDKIMLIRIKIKLVISIKTQNQVTMLLTKANKKILKAYS